MPTLRKAMEQKQRAVTKAIQMKKAPKQIDSGLSNRHKYDDYDTDEL